VSTTPPGPLAEEAARLVEAITEWARGAVGDMPMPSVSNGPECQICPICQLLALVRRTQPETFGHLADASASMVAALRSVIDRHDHASRRHSGVERIDLDDRDPAAEPFDPTPSSPRSGAQDRNALADALGVGRNGRAPRPAAAATPTQKTATRRRWAPQKPPA